MLVWHHSLVAFYNRGVRLSDNLYQLQAGARASTETISRIFSMMMAAARYFIYRGGGRNVIPQDATHVSIDESITTIPAELFRCHENIIELICHAGVKRIESAAFGCLRLRQVVIPGAEIVGWNVFEGCEAVTDIECPKLERIGGHAFRTCKSLSNINLSSAKVVQRNAFNNCEAMTEAKFGKYLESIQWGAFFRCPSLERITIPLKNGLLHRDDIFQECTNLNRIDLAEGEELRDIIDALLLGEWRNDMNEELDSINRILPNTYAGDYYDDEDADYLGDKARVIREWITRVLSKIIRYKAQHRRLLSEAAATLHLILPSDIVMNNVIPFLELPCYKFQGEEEGEE